MKRGSGDAKNESSVATEHTVVRTINTAYEVPWIRRRT